MCCSVSLLKSVQLSTSSKLCQSCCLNNNTNILFIFERAYGIKLHYTRQDNNMIWVIWKWLEECPPTNETLEVYLFSPKWYPFPSSDEQFDIVELTKHKYIGPFNNNRGNMRGTIICFLTQLYFSYGRDCVGLKCNENNKTISCSTQSYHSIN